MKYYTVKELIKKKEQKKERKKGRHDDSKPMLGYLEKTEKK